MVFFLTGDNCKTLNCQAQRLCGNWINNYFQAGNRPFNNIFHAEKGLALTMYFSYWILMFICIFFGMKNEYYHRNAGNANPKHYTLMISDIPKGETIEDVKKFFEKSSVKRKEFKIHTVNFAYHIGDYVKTVRKKAKLFKQAVSMRKKGMSASNEGLVKLKNELIELNEEVKKLKKELINGDEINHKTFTGYAFVTFENINDAKLIHKEWNLSNLGKL